ncbi:MAG: hypothetical protein HKN31_10715 [Pricia sp.]|nr:hypothetical protein [Pricia sp.]
MKARLFLILVGFCAICYAQKDNRISTLDFVEILNDNTEETHYYYKNNWQKLRESALKKGYIHSYEIMETVPTEDSPFHLILVTTYANQVSYDKREDHFGELIEQAGELKLLTAKKPAEFRKILYSKEMVRHWQNTIDQ